MVENFGDHVITEGLRNINLLMSRACPMEPVLPDAEPGVMAASRIQSPYRVTPLLRSGPESWGETDVDALARGRVKLDRETDQPGPVTLAVAVERRPARSNAARAADSPEPFRMIVVGTAGILSDGLFDEFIGNRTFGMNCMSWLADTETKLGIPPQRPEQKKLVASPAAWRIVFFVTVMGMPLASMILGGAVWWIRRKG